MDDLLKDLEHRVETAAKAIEKLKRENSSLRAKVKKLGGDDPKSGGKTAWRKEREVVQKRLTQLAGNLEELI
jgi:cell division septum initiation protein DivIVA